MATIHDVATHAGVSIATVSRVINGNAHVATALAARVRASIEALQYHPSHAARWLRAKHTMIIGLLISDIQNPFFTSLIRGVEDVAQKNGYSLILCNSDENPDKERQYIEVLCAERIAGAIVVPTRENHRDLRLFKEHQIPVVSVDRRIKDQDVDVVLVDNVRGAREAVLHLLTNGYRRIGVITGPITTTTGQERLTGYRQALHEARLPADSSLERYGSFKEESGWQFAHELLDLEPPVDALFVGNNLMMMGALEAINARKLRIPDDIAIVGFDELPWAALRSISLTTVTQPAYELGSTAALRLFQRLQSSIQFTRQEIVLAPTLCIRGSSRPYTHSRTSISSSESTHL